MANDLSTEDAHPGEPSAGAHGIVFRVASRRRFIPYNWLLYADINEAGTEIQFHFSHSTVIVTGTELKELHEWTCDMRLAGVEESAPSVTHSKYPIVRRIEIIEEPSQ